MGTAPARRDLLQQRGAPHRERPHPPDRRRCFHCGGRSLGHHHSPSSLRRGFWRGPRRPLRHTRHLPGAILPLSTAQSRLLAAILALHCTQASLAGYRSSPQGRPWPPAMPCFRCMCSSVSFGCCVCCNDYIHMLQAYVSCCEHMFQVFQTYVSSVSFGCCRSISGCCITCMLQVYVSSVLGVSYVCCKCFIWMLQSRYGYFICFCNGF
jgi:hypothetical protein